MLCVDINVDKRSVDHDPYHHVNIPVHQLMLCLLAT